MKKYKKGDTIVVTLKSELFSLCDFSVLIYREVSKGGVICTDRSKMNRISATCYEQVFEPSVSEGLGTGIYKCQITLFEELPGIQKIVETDAFVLNDSEKCPQ